MPEIKQLNITLPPDLEARFVNMVRISHTPGSSFWISPLSCQCGRTQGKLPYRTLALGLKLMQQAINENVRRYETIFGEICMPSGHTLADDLFNARGNQFPPGVNE